MLHELRLRDFALIDRLAIEFGPGLNAITGETGSGKSLVVTALELLAGARPRGGVGAWVRAGADRAVLEAVFEPPPEGGPAAARVDAWFDRHLPEFEGGAWREEDELLVARVLDGGGRSRARVLGSPVRLGALAELVGALLEVNGQFEQRAVLDTARQTRWYDEIAAGAVGAGPAAGAGTATGVGNSGRARAQEGRLAKALATYRERRSDWLAARRERQDVEDRARERDGRATFLRLALEELDALAPRAGEGSELRRERELLRQSERVVSELGTTAAELSEGEVPIVAQVGAIADRLAAWSSAAEPLHEVAEELSASLVHLENAAAGLVSFLSDVESDPRRLDHVEARLERLERAARRYGLCDPDGVDRLASHAEQLRDEVGGLEDLDASLERCIAAEGAARDRVARAAASLSRARRARAKDFVAAVAPLLDRLGLGRAELEASFVRCGTSGDQSNEHRASGAGTDVTGDTVGVGGSGGERRFGPLGEEEVELVWRPNPGEPARPLAQIASGGEAARVFLALRSAAAAGASDGSSRRCLVFDEVDAAVGGRLAPRVAECLSALGQVGPESTRGSAQVITVTHQPAIAARADRHLAVVKRTRGGRTVARAVLLEGTDRLSEVAAMIAGSGRSPAARAEARRLLAAGPDFSAGPEFAAGPEGAAGPEPAVSESAAPAATANGPAAAPVERRSARAPARRPRGSTGRGGPRSAARKSA